MAIKDEPGDVRERLGNAILNMQKDAS